MIKGKRGSQQHPEGRREACRAREEGQPAASSTLLKREEEKPAEPTLDKREGGQPAPSTLVEREEEKPAEPSPLDKREETKEQKAQDKEPTSEALGKAPSKNKQAKDQVLGPSPKKQRACCS